jgi:erythromycin esterase
MTKTSSRPLNSVDPNSTDDSDLAAFGEIVGKARVVSVGESAHDIRESYLIKDRLFRYLVREHGFTAFVLESGFPEALAINDWILGGPGGIEAIASTGICYGFNTEELRDQFRWMRQWNATHDRKIRFYGLDVAGSGTSPHAGVAACLQRIEPRPGDATLLASAWLGHRFEVEHGYADRTPEERERLWAGIAKLATRAEAQGDETALRSIRAVEILRSMIEGTISEQLAAGHNPRDAFMADTVQWILGREERIMISAHNAHIMRGDVHNAPPMGKVLAPVLGSGMVVVGTTYARGVAPKMGDPAIDMWDISVADLPSPPENTLDALMDAFPSDLHLVDIREIPDGDLASSMRVFHDVWPVDPRGFDALLHLRHVTTAPDAFAAMRHEVELGRAASRRRQAKS